MSWTTPITDRTSADLANRTAKAFWNLADWTRLNANSAEIKAQIAALLGLTVSLDTLSAPTITTFPAAASINALIANIEALRAGACLPEGTGIVPLKHDYVGGNGAVAPDYAAANAWETNQALLHSLLPAAAEYLVRCGVAAVGQARCWQVRFR